MFHIAADNDNYSDDKNLLEYSHDPAYKMHSSSQSGSFPLMMKIGIKSELLILIVINSHLCQSLSSSQML